MPRVVFNLANCNYHTDKVPEVRSRAMRQINRIMHCCFSNCELQTERLLWRSVWRSILDVYERSKLGKLQSCLLRRSLIQTNSAILNDTFVPPQLLRFACNREKYSEVCGNLVSQDTSTSQILLPDTRLIDYLLL